MHGVALAAQRVFQALRGNRKPSGRWLPRLLGQFVTAHFVVLAWVLFRASSLENAAAVLARVQSLTVAWANVPPAVVAVLAIAALAHYVPKRWYEFSRERFAAAPFYAQAAALAVLVMAIEYVAVTGAAPFLYTRF
jgi:D-alanyl-lipoteichoic acid acyltransferase DltB (MBOAT superfamily)